MDSRSDLSAKAPDCARPSKPAVAHPGSPSAPPLDYLRHETASAFFDAREHEAYYRSLKRGDAGQRAACRAFHDRLRPVLLRLLALADDDGIALLEQLITATAREAKQAAGEKTRRCPADRVRRVEPEGMRILGDDAGRDLEHLRAAYRAAALRCHPDRGGSHEDMVAVNRAFEMLHRLLVEEAGAAPIVNGDGEPTAAFRKTPNARAYLWTVRRLLLDIALDGWALEEASVYLAELASDTARCSENRGQRMIDLFGPACKLTQRLCAAGRADSAARSLVVAQESLRVGGTRNIDLDYLGGFRKAKECVAGTRKPQFLLESVGQVENAFRLGAIDWKRYQRDSVARHEDGEPQRSRSSRTPRDSRAHAVRPATAIRYPTEAVAEPCPNGASPGVL